MYTEQITEENILTSIKTIDALLKMEVKDYSAFTQNKNSAAQKTLQDLKEMLFYFHNGGRQLHLGCWERDHYEKMKRKNFQTEKSLIKFNY